uniref:Venom protein n=1 Tax=Hemiscolopendra marginata TaxID=943146 RepID=A0A646QE43_9MYRI
MCHLILATILAVGVIRSQADDISLCPDVQSEPLRGVDGRWFSIYRNHKMTVNCDYADIVSLGHDKFSYNVTWQPNTVEPYNIASTIMKDADGKYYVFMIDEEGPYKIEQIVMKVDGDFLFVWSCYVHAKMYIPEQNRYVAYEMTGVYSKTPRYSPDIIDKINTWLIKKGLQVQPLTETRFDGCPRK